MISVGVLLINGSYGPLRQRSVPKPGWDGQGRLRPEEQPVAPQPSLTTEPSLHPPATG